MKPPIVTVWSVCLGGWRNRVSGLQAEMGKGMELYKYYYKIRMNQRVNEKNIIRDRKESERVQKL